MKRNKIAAGVLALAMGLSAVAPSFADDTKTVELKSTELFQEEYKSLLERTNKERNDYLAAKSAYDTAEKELEDSKALVLQKAKEYEELRSSKESNLRVMIEEEQNAWDYLDGIVTGGVAKKLINRTTATYEIYSITFGRGWTYNVIPHTVTYATSEVVNLNEETLVKYVKEYAGYNADGSGRTYNEQELRAAYRRWYNANADLVRWTADIQKLTAKLQELRAAETARDVAQTKYDNAKAELAKHTAKNGKLIWENSLAEVRLAAEGYNVTIQATDKGVVIVKKEESKEITAEQLAKLQKSIDEAEVTLKSVEVLKNIMPNTSKANMAKLDALVADQKAAIAKAEALIKANKKVAFISTAYASEEATAEDVDALIKELDDNTAAIQDEMKKLDGEVKEEEKPAEKEEEKPAEKPAEKEEDKKDDDKKEKVVEKVVVKEKATNKKAGSNAKTGIAGVAGVAGVLAAASVAYAASKKNN